MHHRHLRREWRSDRAQDRILDMLRTVTNVTGDATVAVSVASMENQLGDPDLNEKEDKPKIRAN